jgi:hypothetical protein
MSPEIKLKSGGGPFCLLSKAVLPFSVLFIFLFGSVLASVQRIHPGRGTISTQDLAKMTAPAASGSGAADSVCARFATDSRLEAGQALPASSCCFSFGADGAVERCLLWPSSRSSLLRLDAAAPQRQTQAQPTALMPS